MLQRLAIIRFAKYVGFTLPEIAQLLLKQMLHDTLSQTCPKLVERSSALTG